jgi:hypothetical protein
VRSAPCTVTHSSKAKKKPLRPFSSSSLLFQSQTPRCPLLGAVGISRSVSIELATAEAQKRRRSDSSSLFSPSLGVPTTRGHCNLRPTDAFLASSNTRVRCETVPVQSTESKLVLSLTFDFALPSLPPFLPSPCPPSFLLYRLPTRFPPPSIVLDRSRRSLALPPTFPSLPHQPSTMPESKKDPAVLARERNVRHVSCQNVRPLSPSLPRRFVLTSPPPHSAESGK